MQVGEERQSPSSMDTDSSQSITSDSSSDSESMDTDDNQSEVEQSKTPIPNGIQSASTFPTNQTGIENSLPSNKADKMDIDERSERSSDSESSDSSLSASSSPSSSRAPSESRAGLSAKEQPSENVDSKDPEMTGVQSVMVTTTCDRGEQQLTVTSKIIPRFLRPILVLSASSNRSVCTQSSKNLSRAATSR